MRKVDSKRRAQIGRDKRARTRDIIIQTALGVIAKQGFDGPTIDDFVTAASIARGTFYNHFQTRERLLAAVAAHVVDELDQRMLPVYSGFKNPTDRMSVALRVYLRMSQERPDWGWLMIRMIPIEGAPLSPAMRKGVIRDFTMGAKQGKLKLRSMEAAIAAGLGILVMGIRAVLGGKTADDFPEILAEMALRCFGVAAADAARSARVPLPPFVVLPQASREIASLAPPPILVDRRRRVAITN